ncbi:hypothetical protein RRG08_004674 [Elysia crispata]|uniref:Uncharacterized protein n=1 Tax=Elysia crispata TaxID=231223 RepID=A0AAE1AC32_9GAST|nr:hypothetical protein RRG08_004674 [Elysia crispata]
MISFDYGTSRGAMCDSDQLTVLLRVAVIIIHVLALFRVRDENWCYHGDALTVRAVQGLGFPILIVDWELDLNPNKPSVKEMTHEIS